MQVLKDGRSREERADHSERSGPKAILEARRITTTTQNLIN